MKKQDWLAGMLMAGALLVGCENVEEPVDTVVEQEVQEEEVIEVDNQAQEEVEKLQKLQQEAVAMQEEIETLRKALDEERAKAPAVEVKKEVEYVYVPKTEYVYIPKTEYVEVEKEVIVEVEKEVIVEVPVEVEPETPKEEIQKPQEPEVIVPPVVEPEQPQQPQQPEVPEVEKPVEPEVPEVPEQPETPEQPVELQEAIQFAKDYINATGVSRNALFQLLAQVHGYSSDTARYAIETVENEGFVDWHEEAKQAAQAYINSGAGISYKNLIQVLQMADQFTSEQAQAAVDAIKGNVNWKVQCVYAAQRYIDAVPGIDRETVKQTLLYAEQFTQDEINYAIGQLY